MTDLSVFISERFNLARGAMHACIARVAHGATPTKGSILS